MLKLTNEKCAAETIFTEFLNQTRTKSCFEEQKAGCHMLII